MFKFFMAFIILLFSPIWATLGAIVQVHYMIFHPAEVGDAIRELKCKR